MRAGLEMAVQQNGLEERGDRCRQPQRAGGDAGPVDGRRGRCPPVDHPRRPERRCVPANGQPHHGGRCPAPVRPARRSRHALRRSRTDAEGKAAAVRPALLAARFPATATGSWPPPNAPPGRPSSVAQASRPWWNRIGPDGHATICAEVERRATTTLDVGERKSTALLDIALDHLTLARVGLVRAILTHPLPQPALDLPHVAAAVNGLRDAGTTRLSTQRPAHRRALSLRPRRCRVGPHGPRPGPGDRRARPDAALPRRHPPPPRPPLPRPGRARQSPRPHPRSTATAAARTSWKTPKPPPATGPHEGSRTTRHGITGSRRAVIQPGNS